MTHHPSTALNPDSPIPLFMQIRMALLSEILRWPDPKDRFYGDNELAARFEVSRMTVRQAIAGLVSEGLLRRQSGQGTFVTERVFVERLDQALDIESQYAEVGVHQKVRVIEFDVRDARADEAQTLDLGPKPRVLSIRRVRSVGSSPVAVDERLLCADAARSAQFNRDAAAGSLVDRLRSAITLHEASWTIGAGRAGETLAALLYLDPSDPVLDRRMTYRTTDQRRILTGRTVHRADMVRYGFELRLDEGRENPREMTRIGGENRADR